MGLRTKIKKLFGQEKVSPDLCNNNHDYYMALVWGHFGLRSKTLVDKNMKIFLGDSIIARVCVESHFNAINFGISGESVAGATSHVAKLENLENKTIIIAYGVNDIPNETNQIFEDFMKFIECLPKSSKIFISSILPINEAEVENAFKIKKSNVQITEINHLLEEFTDTQENIHFINSGKYLLDNSLKLGDEYHVGDGLHLNDLGNKYFLKGLSEVLDIDKVKDSAN